MSSTPDDSSFQAQNHSSNSFLGRFFAWSESQHNNRILWVAVALLVQIGAAIPITAAAVMLLGGNSFFLWLIILAINVPVLIMNLAAMPTKYTIPALFGAWAAEVLVIIYCVLHSLL